MKADTTRYARITQRLAEALTSSEVASSPELASTLEARIVAAIVDDCAPRITAPGRAERLQQAVTALIEHGVLLRTAGGVVIRERCFCGADDCGHAAMLIERLLGVLPAVGAIDTVRYT
jgi:hypothetical protein